MAYQLCSKCFKASWLINDLTCDLKIAATSKNVELAKFSKKLLISIGDTENVGIKKSRAHGDYV